MQEKLENIYFSFFLRRIVLSCSGFRLRLEIEVKFALDFFITFLYHIWQSINYVVSKSAILTPANPFAIVSMSKFGDFCPIKKSNLELYLNIRAPEQAGYKHKKDQLGKWPIV